MKKKHFTQPGSHTNKENKKVKYNILVLNIKGKINKIAITSNNVFTLINNKSMGKNDF
jgi:hypothetical protein